MTEEQAEGIRSSINCLAIVLVIGLFVWTVYTLAPRPNLRAYGPVKLPIGTDDRSICLDERVGMVAIFATVHKVDRLKLDDNEIVKMARMLTNTREPMYPYDLKPHYAEAYK